MLPLATLSQLTLAHYLAIGSTLFVLGLIGFVTRRNLILMFLCTEMMFQGIAVTLIAFAKHHGNLAGQSFVIFILTVAACEAALALGLVVLLFRRRRTLDADAWHDLNG